MKDTCTIWVCQDCMLHHANGECGNCHENAADPYRKTDAHDCEPLTLVDFTKVAMGVVWKEHAEDCVFGTLDGPNISTGVGSECSCEIKTFSWSTCEGCGSTLGGERHAMTLWFD